MEDLNLSNILRAFACTDNVSYIPATLACVWYRFTRTYCGELEIIGGTRHPEWLMMMMMSGDQKHVHLCTIYIYMVSGTKGNEYNAEMSSRSTISKGSVGSLVHAM